MPKQLGNLRRFNEDRYLRLRERLLLALKHVETAGDVTGKGDAVSSKLRKRPTHTTKVLRTIWLVRHGLSVVTLAQRHTILGLEVRRRCRQTRHGAATSAGAGRGTLSLMVVGPSSGSGCCLHLGIDKRDDSEL